MLARHEIPGRRPAGNHEGARRDLQRRPQCPPRSRGAGDKSCCAAPRGTGPRCVERPPGSGLQADLE